MSTIVPTPTLTRAVARRCDYGADCNLRNPDDCVVIEQYGTAVHTDADGNLFHDTEDRLRSHSHAHRLTHVGCRIGDFGVACEDHTAAAPGELLEQPPMVAFRPMCLLCHGLFGHPRLEHHDGGGPRVSGDRLVLHRDHPDTPALAAGLTAEVHHDDPATCTVCAPRMAACDGCRDAILSSM